MSGNADSVSRARQMTDDAVIPTWADLAADGDNAAEQTTPLTLAQFAWLIASLYRDKPNEHVLSIGEWLPPPAPGYELPLFRATVRVTVGDFRRWAGREPW